MGIRCLLCNGEMKLAMTESESWWQCQLNPTHRMSLVEYSDLAYKERSKEQIIKAMKERQTILQVQLDENRIGDNEIKKKRSPKLSEIKVRKGVGLDGFN